MANSFFDPITATYHSPHPPLGFPADTNLSMTSHLFQNTSSLSECIALIDAESNDSVTFRQLKLRVSIFSRVLSRMFGISKSDVVLVISPNSAHFPVFFLSIISLGAIVTACNPVCTVRDMAEQIEDCRPKLVITIPELFEKVRGFGLRVICSGTTGCPGSWNYFELVDMEEQGTGFHHPVPDVAIQDDVAAIMYSSGTTGKSKGVVLTHRNFIAASMMMTFDQERHGEGRNVFLMVVPSFHVMGLSCVLFAQLARGNMVVVMKKFELENALCLVERYRVTNTGVAPPVLFALAKGGNSMARKYDLSSLRQIASGASALSKDVMEVCQKILPHTLVVQGYGMTETCGIISMEDREDALGSGSSGTLRPGVEAKIVDLDSMEALPPNRRGEIWVRGPNLMRGYLNNLAATELTIDGRGWLHTGDLGYFDDEGRIFIINRLKDLIKCYGYQVAPAELEELLLTHPGISDAVVVPSPDARAGEVPVAFVVQSDGITLVEDDIMKFIAKQVAPYKRLRIVKFVESIPKTATGKVSRLELKEKLIAMSKL